MATAEQLFQEVADLVMGSAPKGWAQIWIKAEVGSDWAESIYDYQSPSSERTWFEPSGEVQYRINKALQELRQLMSKSGKEPWTIVHFAMERGGKFNYNFEYGSKDAA